MDAVERRKLHLHVADLRKDAQRLRRLVELTRPVQMPSLLPRSGPGLRSGCRSGRHQIPESQSPDIVTQFPLWMLTPIQKCFIAALKH